MSESLNNAKPVRFANSSVYHKKSKPDGKGNIDVTFYLTFSFVDENEKTTTAEGQMRWRIEVWRTGRNAWGEPYKEDLSKIEGQGSLLPDRFYRVEDGEFRDQIWYREVSFRPMKLKIDVVEWKYSYELWYKPKGLFSSELYDGHTSEYWSIDPRA